MKKLNKVLATTLATTIALASLVVPVSADSSASWNFKDSGFNKLSSITSSVTVNSLKLIGTSAKPMSVNADTQTLSGTTYTYCLATGGAGSTSYRTVNIPVTKSATNTVKITMRSSGSDTRTLKVTDPSGNSLANLSAASGISTQTYTYTGNNSNIYIYSTNSNINIYKIQVDTKDGTSSSSSGSSSSGSSSSGSSSSGSTTTTDSNGIYVSTSGSDSNDGSSSKPYKTVAKAVSAAKSGKTIYISGGTYKETATIKLTSSNIKIVGNGAQPVIDFSSMGTADANRGIQISGSSYTLQNLKIQNAGDNGIYISGSSNTVDNCYITKCQDTGLQMSNGASNNTIKNCTSTYNYDDKTGGENADGYAAKLSIGSGNTFTKCIADKNSDDGFDFYEAGNAVKLYNCEANNAGVNNGNGQGFKVGGNYTADKHYLEGCTATGNKKRGYDQNNNTGAITLVNCKGISNNVNFYFPTKPSSGAHSFTGCTSTSGSSKDVVVGNQSGCSFKS